MAKLAGNLTLGVGPSTEGFWQKVNAGLKKGRPAEVNVPVNPSLKRADAELLAWRKRQEHNALNIPVTVDERSARSSIKRIETVFKQSSLSKAIRLQVIVAGASALPLLAQGALSAATAITELAQSALLLPGIFSGLAATVGTLLTGISGLGAAFKASNDSVQKGAQFSREYERASRDLEKAQRGVVQALKDANREIQDQHDKLTSGALSVEQAQINVSKANERLAQGGFKTFSDYRQAVLDTRTTVFDLSQAIKENGRNVQDYYDNSKKSATQTDTFRDALDQLSNSADGFTKAQNEMSGASEQFLNAMANLSPAGREFVNQILSIKGAWKELQGAVQDTLIQGLGTQIVDLANKRLPALRAGMKQVAAGLNTDLKQLLTSLGSDKNASAIAQIFQSVGKALTAAAPGINSFVNGFLKLSQVGATFLPRLAQAFNTVAGRFENFVNRASEDGSLERWIDRGLRVIDSLGNALGSIVSIFNSVTEAYEKATGNVGGFASTAERGLGKLADYLKSPKGQDTLVHYLKEAGDFLDGIKKAMPGIIDAFQTFSDAARTFASIIFPVFGFLGKTLQQHIGLTKILLGLYFGWRTWKPIGDQLAKIWGRASVSADNHKKKLLELKAAQQTLIDHGPALASAQRLQAQSAVAFADALDKGQGATANAARAQAHYNDTLAAHGAKAGKTKQAALDLNIARWRETEALGNVNLRQGQYNTLSDEVHRRTRLVNDATERLGGPTGFSGLAKKIGSKGSAIAGTLVGALGGLLSTIGTIGATAGLLFALDRLSENQRKAGDAAEYHRSREAALRTELDQTTGAVTEAAKNQDLRDVQHLKVRGGDNRLVDANAVTDAAKLNISPDTLKKSFDPQQIDSINKVQQTADQDTLSAVTGGKDAQWNRFGPELQKFGVTAAVYAKAINGDPDSVAKFEAAQKEFFKSKGDVTGTGRFVPGDVRVNLGAGAENLIHAGVAGVSVGQAQRSTLEAHRAGGQDIKQGGTPATLNPANPFAAYHPSDVFVGPDGTSVGFNVTGVTPDKANLLQQGDPNNPASESFQLTPLDRAAGRYSVSLSGDQLHKYVQGFSRGGNVWGAGDATSDSIPAMLSNGEFVLNAKAAEHYGADTLYGMNAMKLPKHSTGGPIKLDPNWAAPGDPGYINPGLVRQNPLYSRGTPHGLYDLHPGAESGWKPGLMQPSSPLWTGQLTHFAIGGGVWQKPKFDWRPPGGVRSGPLGGPGNTPAPPFTPAIAPLPGSGSAPVAPTLYVPKAGTPIPIAPWSTPGDANQVSRSIAGRVVQPNAATKLANGLAPWGPDLPVNQQLNFPRGGGNGPHRGTRLQGGPTLPINAFRSPAVPPKIDHAPSGGPFGVGPGGVSTAPGIPGAVSAPKSIVSQLPAAAPTTAPLQPGQIPTFDQLNNTSPGSIVAQAGQIPGVRELLTPSTNKSSRGNVKPDLFLVHTSESDLNAQDLAAWMQGQGDRSYNYLIDKNGQLTVDAVNPNEAAWSVGPNGNSRSINAVIAGSHASWTREEWLANARGGIQTLASIAARDTAAFGIPQQLLQGDLQTGIGGHEWVSQHLGGTDHTDPGAGFPWDVFMQDLQSFKDNPASAPAVAASTDGGVPAVPDGSGSNYIPLPSTTPPDGSIASQIPGIPGLTAPIQGPNGPVPFSGTDFLSQIGHILLQAVLGFFGIDISQITGPLKSIIGGVGAQNAQTQQGTEPADPGPDQTVIQQMVDQAAQLKAQGNEAGARALLDEANNYASRGQSPIGADGANVAAGAPAAAYNPTAGTEQWRPVVQQALQERAAQYGITNIDAWTQDILGQIQFESKGDPGALNPKDSDGLPAIGLGQFKQGTFDAHNVTGGSIHDGRAQVYAMIDYLASSRYGVVPGGGVNWGSYGWRNGSGYAAGGPVRRYDTGGGVDDRILQHGRRTGAWPTPTTPGSAQGAPGDIAPRPSPFVQQFGIWRVAKGGLIRRYNTGGPADKGHIDPVMLGALGSQVGYLMTMYGIGMSGHGIGDESRPMWKARGGHVRGPGGPTDDRIPAYLSNGEFVMKADAVKHYGMGAMVAMNGMKVPHLAGGGDPLGIGNWLNPIPPAGGPGPLPLPPAGQYGTVDPSKPMQPGPGVGNGVQPLAQIAQAAGEGVGAFLSPKGVGDVGGGWTGATTGGGADPRSVPGAPPATTEHLNPAVKQGIEGAFSTIGSLAGTAASLALNAVAPGAGSAAGAGIQGGAQIAGQLASGLANVGASLLVGTVTPGTTGQGYGAPLSKPQPQGGGGSSYTSIHNGNVVAYNPDQALALKERKERQAALPFLNRSS